MTFVLDASVAMAWCFEEEAGSSSQSIMDRLASDAAITPAIWVFEVTNAMIVGERRGRVSQAHANEFLAVLRRLPIKVQEENPGLSSVLDSARHHNLSTYDAAYFLLAEQRGLPLATLDKRLAGAASNAGVELLIK